jgi:putative tryptophan/tyrosine transport system substrate-binding protein
MTGRVRSVLGQILIMIVCWAKRDIGDRLMKRRDIVVGVIAGVAAAALAFEAGAQQPGRTYRIALLAPFRRTDQLNRWYLEELERNGFVAGQNLVLDDSGLGVPIADLQAAADRLVKAGPDLFMAWGPAAAHAAQHATTSIPIVAYADDPVESGLVASMSLPGGNTTGVGLLTSQLDAKRLEVLNELLPTAKRIGLLVDPQQKTGLREVEAVGRDLGLELIAEEVRNVDGISRGIDALAAAHVEAINVLASGMLYGGRKLIIDRTRALRLPTMYWWAGLVRDGGLIGYGPNQEEAARLNGQQAVRVLKGAAPGQLPVLQPTRLELVINLGTAKSIGVIIPQSLLLRADEVIE